MTDRIRLRLYQQEAVDAVFKAWADGMQRPAIVLATGLGKTILFSAVIERFIQETSQRVIVLAHRDELCDQAIDKIRQVAPGLDVGKVKAADNETRAQVMVCSVQTLVNDRRMDALLSGPRIGLVVVDEVHHYASRTFRGVLERLGCLRPDGARMLGVTATLARGDGVGLGGVVDDVVTQRGTLFGIKNGFLVDVRGVRVEVKDLDLSSVKRSRGDYSSGDLGRAMQESELSDVLPAAYKEHAADRQGIVFTPTVATAQGLADVFSDHGIKSAMVCGETPREERLRIYAAYRRHEIQVMTNAMVLTEGFDMPQASCAVIARPTQSNPLYIQMVGRVLRTWPGKKDALVLDVAGAGTGNKLCTLVDLEPGVVQSLKEGESLTEAEEREEVERGQPAQGGKLKITTGEFDMFSGSSHAWLVTRKGLLFIPVGDAGEVFLWQSKADGLWHVVHSAKDGSRQRLRGDLSLDMAKAWAETEAEELMDFNTGRSASWRKKKPTEAQTALAKRLGITVRDTDRAGDVGNLISVAFASRKLDQFAG